MPGARPSTPVVIMQWGGRFALDANHCMITTGVSGGRPGRESDTKYGNPRFLNDYATCMDHFRDDRSFINAFSIRSSRSAISARSRRIASSSGFFSWPTNVAAIVAVRMA